MSGDFPEEREDDTALEANVEAMLRRAPPTPKMEPDARGRVLAALLARQAAKGPARAEAHVVELPRRPVRVREAMMLATVGIAAGFMGLFFTGDMFRPTRVHENDGRGPMTVSLLDGSTALLDEGARIEERGKASVRVERGGVIFDVVHGRGLRVEAGAARIKSLGTKFLVRASDEETQVAVARGKVELVASGGETIVAAGQQGLVRGDERPESSPAPRLSHLFGFARSAEAPPLEDEAGAVPRRRGTLIARDPRWGGERPLEIRDLVVDVVVEDGVARTTVDQTFFNADNRQLEGKYQLPLPQGAAISRLGMYVDGQLMEAAVVDRDRGRNIYEGIVYQRRDPALLEWMSGNSFTMRVFPLPARTEKRIFLSYTQTLEHLYDTDRLVVPIPAVDLPAQKVKFRVRVADAAGMDLRSPSHDVNVISDGEDRVATFEASSYTLGDDFVLAMRRPSREAELARSYEADGSRFISARVSPDLTDARRAPVAGRWVVLYDTSGSRSTETLAAQRRFVGALVRELDDEAEVSILAVDHDARPILPRFTPAAELDLGALEAALKREGENAAGDTRLEVGLRAAAGALGSDVQDGDTIVYVGDGIPTGEDREAEAIARAVPSSVRFAAVAVGDTVDAKLLDDLANRRTGVAVAVGTEENLADRAFDFVSALRTPCVRDLTAQVLTATGSPISGARAHLASKRACDGERIDVVARLPGATPGPVSVRIEGRTERGEVFTRTVDAGTTRGDAAYLPRLWAQREIDTLLAGGPREGSRQAIVELATKHVLATPYTSLLVLENDAMYREYGVTKQEATGWAVYDAPKKIDVRYEPLGSEPIALDASWDLVHRLPTRLIAPDPTMMTWIGQLNGIGAGGGGRGWGTGQGFGSGSGRLGGRHRDGVETKASRRGLDTGRVLPAARPGPAPLSGERARLDVAEERLVQRSTFKAAADLGTIGLLRTEDVPMGTTLLPSTGTAPDFFQAAIGGALPVAFASSYDARFDDLTELAPALTMTPVDSIREAAMVAARVAPAPIPSDAAAALTRARQALRPATYRVERTDGTTRLTVSAGGAIEWVRPKEGERTVYDNHVMTSNYAELDLAVRRRIDAAAPWLLASDAPFVAPLPETLAGLTVTLTSDGSVSITAPAAGTAADGLAEFEDLELGFDDAGRVDEVRWIARGAAKITTIRYGAAGDITVTSPDGTETRYLPESGAANAQPDPSTLVEVPVATPARLDERLASASAGSQAFVDANRAKLAACAALADDGCGRDAALALLGARGSLTAGEIVLASHALDRAGEEDRKKLLASLPPSSPIRRILAANLEPDTNKRRSAYARLDLAPGPLASWTQYRSILMDLESEGTPSDATRARAIAFAKDRTARADLRFLLVRAAAERVRWSDQAASGRIWESLADDPEVGFLADRSRALIDPWSKPEESSALLIRAFEAALARGVAPGVDWQVRDIVRRGRGDVGLRLFWARWRDHLVRKGTADQVLAYVATLARGIRPSDGNAPQLFDDLDPILARFEQSGGGGALQRLVLAHNLITLDRPSDADRVLEPLASGPDPAPEALDLRAEAAERLGRFADAARAVERAAEISADLEIPIELVRRRYQKLLGLHVKRHKANAAERTIALAAIVDTARDWRREDPDNTEVDLTVAAAMDRLGLNAEATRQLYSIVDRHPGEGESFAKVAAAMEDRGEFDEAVALYTRAAAVEPTNPTWLLQKSHLLRARGRAGDPSAARALLEQIERGKWQDRFAPQVNEAKRLLAESR